MHLSTISLTGHKDAHAFHEQLLVDSLKRALRTAQLAADLNFGGVPAFYSWPSRGKRVGYVADKENARNSGDYLAKFVTDLTRQARADKIHLVAHSMGSEVVASMLAALGPSPTIRLGQVGLIAPDLDVRRFRKHTQPQLLRVADRITLYASNEDRALQLSRVMNGVWRLGLGGDSLVVLDSLDTVDATRVRTDMMGHGSFESAAFLGDLHAVLNASEPPPRRLLRIPRGELAFWRFRPAHAP